MHRMMLNDLQNEISNVGEYTGITVTLRLGRVRHLSAQISLQKDRTGNGSHTQPSLYPLYVVTIIIHQAANLSASQLLVLFP